MWEKTDRETLYNTGKKKLSNEPKNRQNARKTRVNERKDTNEGKTKTKGKENKSKYERKELGKKLYNTGGEKTVKMKLKVRE